MSYLPSGNACETIGELFQEFVVGQNDYELASISLSLKRIGTGSGYVTVTIRKRPLEDVLTSGQVLASSISTEYSMIKFNVTPITLEANTWYFITLEYPNIMSVLSWETRDSLQFVFEFSGPEGEQLLNADFEDALNNWTFDSEHFFSCAYTPHSGSLDCGTKGTEWVSDFIEQTVNNVACNKVTQCGIWAKVAYTNPPEEVSITVFYSDSSTSSHTYTIANDYNWHYLDFLSYLSSGKAITKIRFTCKNGHMFDDSTLYC
jgi:hypothetical protein